MVISFPSFCDSIKSDPQTTVGFLLGFIRFVVVILEDRQNKCLRTKIGGLTVAVAVDEYGGSELEIRVFGCILDVQVYDCLCFSLYLSFNLSVVYFIIIL